MTNIISTIELDSIIIKKILNNPGLFPNHIAHQKMFDHSYQKTKLKRKLKWLHKWEATGSKH